MRNLIDNGQRMMDDGGWRMDNGQCDSCFSLSELNSKMFNVQRSIINLKRFSILKFAFVLIFNFQFSIFNYAQDIHFSQFNFAPLSQNPGLTGLFEGDVRFVANYRNQWFTVPVNYNTFSFSTDGTIKTWKERHSLTGGGLFYYDRAGDSRFSSIQAVLSLGYIVQLDKAKTHSLSLGAGLGVGGRSIKYQYLYFDNQYNGDRFNPNLQSGEDIPDASFYYPDVSAGFAYKYRKSARKSLTIGLGIHHLNQPKQSFFNDKSVQLNLRYSASVSLRWQVHKKLDIVPEILFQQQDTKYEFAFGMHTKAFVFKQSKAQICLNTGVYYRNNDAVYFLVGMDYDAWQVNLSYDVNVSKFQRASRNYGALEASVIYILSRVKNVQSKGSNCQIF